MNSKLYKMLRRKDFVLKINQLIHKVSYHKTLKLMEKRASLDLFNYKELAEPLPMLLIDKYPENNLYGMAYVLKNYLNLKSNCINIKSYIEHGLFFGDYVARYSYMYDCKYIITFGKYRENILMGNNNIKDSGKVIIPIGPFIQYTDSLINKSELRKIKEKLGKILLVFPSHSIEDMTTEFNNNEFVQEIERVKRENAFDTVIVSLYWKDIIEKKDLCDEYEKKGYKIVCSGHKNDINFLSRQRSLIELSDMTISNEVGTHVGYCVCLGKPHYVFSQNVTFKEGLESVMKTENGSSAMFDSQIRDKNAITAKFQDYRETISNDQIEIIEYYWGRFAKISKEELLHKLIYND